MNTLYSNEKRRQRTLTRFGRLVVLALCCAAVCLTMALMSGCGDESTPARGSKGCPNGALCSDIANDCGIPLCSELPDGGADAAQ